MTSPTSIRLRAVYHIARAGFLDRVRRYSYLVTLAFGIYVGYSVWTGKVHLNVAGHRGIYNSAWLGLLLSLCISVFISLIGFYIVRGSVQEDEETRVGTILATTPMSRFEYVAAKMLSNLLVLASVLVTLALSGVAMQWIRAEDPQVHLWALLSPFLLIALPAIIVTAAMAVLFDVTPGLRTGFGNVAYFFLWTFVLASSVNHRNDFAGVHIAYDSIMRTLGLPPQGRAEFSFNLGIEHGVREIFRFESIPWTLAYVGSRFIWIGIAAALVVLAALLFRRFDPAAEFFPGFSRKQKPALGVTVGVIAATPIPLDHHFEFSKLTTARLVAAPQSMLRLVTGELRLLLKGRPWWWLAVASILALVCLFNKAEGHTSALVFAWIWPVLVWSQLGCREEVSGTEKILYSTPHGAARLLMAQWIAGIMIAALIGFGAALRLLIAGRAHELFNWCAAAIFISALAVALGAWSGRNKVFEAVYVALWYIGPLHATPSFDFIGVTPASAEPIKFAALALALIASAILARKFRTRIAL